MRRPPAGPDLEAGPLTHPDAAGEAAAATDRRTVLKGIGAGLGAAALGGVPKLVDAAGEPLNVLFISIDDLNDWTGVLGGHPQARTPHLDELAGRSVSFENAHCNAPACNPSRTATLTGRAPHVTGVYGNDQPFRLQMPRAVTLPQLFLAHGYKVMGAGKVFHAGDPESWEKYKPRDGCGMPREKKKSLPKAKPANGIPGSRRFDWGASRSNRDGKQADDRVADKVVGWLNKRHRQPFFIGCGFFRPHLPWYVPQKWFDMYPLDSLDLPTVAKGDLDDIPNAGRRFVRLEAHERITGAGQWKQAVQGYLASLSFADHQLGRVLEALAKGPNGGRTVIVVWSDHGWSLGTKFHWKKFALWEECTRVPLIIKVPGLTPKGATCDRPVGLLDLYPTVADVCGVPLPERLDGRSLRPLLKDAKASWDRPVLTTHLRKNHAVRSERYRYIRYADASEELYDHSNDPHEWHNLADKSSMASVKSDLRQHLPDEDAPEAPSGAHPCGDEEDE